MTEGFATEFDQPFFSGTAATSTDVGMPITIDGRGFMPDFNAPGFYTLFARKGVQLLNTQQASGDGDTASIAPEVWRRSVESWHMGADQRRWDRATSLSARFHRSVGIDPWDNYGFNLLHDADVLTTMASNETAVLCSIGTAVHAGIGANIFSWTDVTAVPTAHTAPGNVLSMTSDGESLFALCSNGAVIKRDLAGTWTTFYTESGFNAAKASLGFVKGFIVLGNGPVLKNITNPGAVVTIYTHLLSTWWWRDITDGAAAVYILGGMGDRWQVYRMTLNSSGSAFDPPISAAPIPDGEEGYALGTYLGYVLIGTKNGWRFGVPDASGQISFGQLIPTAGPVRCFEGQGRFVWFGLSLRPTDMGTVATRKKTAYSEQGGLGRMDLSTFIAPMTPAHAPDLGVGTGTTRSVASVGSTYDGLGKRVYSVDGVGIFVEADELTPTGYLDSGEIVFGSTDRKMGLYAQVFHEPLDGKVTLTIAQDGGTFVPVALNDRPDSTSMGNVNYAHDFDSLELRVTLDRSATDPTQGPRVTRTEFRALDIPGRATEWTIPLLIVENQVYDDVVKARDIVDDYDFLMELVRSRRPFTYQEGLRQWTLHATDFTYHNQTLTLDDRAYQGTFVLVARELT